MNILAVDIGNTNIVLGLFYGKNLKKISRFKTSAKAFKQHIKKIGIKAPAHVIISSVVPSIEKSVSSSIQKKFKIKPLFVTFGIFGDQLPILIKNRSEVGSDRLVNAFAAKILYGKPAIIIDFGTATTFCAVDKKGRYIGGAISTGVAISRDALHEKTAKLPLVDLKFPKAIIGKNTVSSMQSGILWGYIGMVEKIVGLMKRTMTRTMTRTRTRRRTRRSRRRRIKVIATGGLAKILASQTDIIEIVDRNLTLKGLYLIWERICGKSKRK